MVDAVHEPPSTGDVGSDESPSRKVTSASGRPSNSAAICVMIVYVPVPMSAVALETVSLPSASARLLPRLFAVWLPRFRPPCPCRLDRCRRAWTPVLDCAVSNQRRRRHVDSTRGVLCLKKAYLCFGLDRYSSLAQLDGIDADFDRQFIHGRFQAQINAPGCAGARMSIGVYKSSGASR